MDCPRCGRALETPDELELRRCLRCQSESLEVYRPPADHSELALRSDVARSAKFSRAPAHLALLGLSATAANSVLALLFASGLWSLPRIVHALYDADPAGAANFISHDMIKILVIYEVVLLVVYALTGTAFCFWMYRASSALAGRRRLKITPRWVVLWWLIPIANLFKPYEAMVELWRASHPDNGKDWALDSRSPILPIWWACWLCGNIATGIASRIALSPASRQTGDTGSDVAFVGSVLSLAAAGLAAVIVWKIQGRAERLLAKPRRGSKGRKK